MTICAPLNDDLDKHYLGAMCIDVIPTILSKNSSTEDNYLQNMYLSQTASDVNYVIADKRDSVKIITSIMAVGYK